MQQVIEYNKRLANHERQANIDMINHLPQPNMMGSYAVVPGRMVGGKRVRQWAVASGSNYGPSSLYVGNMDDDEPENPTMLQQQYIDDDDEGAQGLIGNAANVQGGSIGKFFKGLAHGVEGVGKELVNEAKNDVVKGVKQNIKSSLNDAMTEAPEAAVAAGRSCGGKISFKSIGRQAQSLAKKAAKEIKPHAQSVLKEAKKALKETGREAKKEAKQFYHEEVKPQLREVNKEILQPAKQQRLDAFKENAKSKIQDAKSRLKDAVEFTPSPQPQPEPEMQPEMEPEDGSGRKRKPRAKKIKGGAVLPDVHPSQYQHSTLPPQLHQFMSKKQLLSNLDQKPPLAPIQKQYVGGRKQLPQSGVKRNTARGDIVSAIMKQRKVGLAEASRIVKAEGLY